MSEQQNSFQGGATKAGAHQRQLDELLADREGNRPLWVRAPKPGKVEHYSGLSRAHLYQLMAERKIKTRSVRQSGCVRGVRLFLLSSILEYIDREGVEDCAPLGAAEGEE